MPDKPFFMYFAPEATHAPHRSDRVVGQVQGALRPGLGRAARGDPDSAKGARSRTRRTELTARHEEIPAWEDMPDGLRLILPPARWRSTPASSSTPTTTSDGLSTRSTTSACSRTRSSTTSSATTGRAPGRVQRRLQRDLPLQRRRRTRDARVHGRADRRLRHTEGLQPLRGRLGARDGHYQWTKQVASHWGGTRNGTIVHWPRGITARGEVRTQFHHVIDVAPTVLEAAGLPQPTTVNGVAQQPIEGVSMAYSFDGATEDDRHDTQYFEMFCNRGVYQQGWTAVTNHGVPWVMGALPPFSHDVWSSTTRIRTGARRTTSPPRCRLAELQQLWLDEARKYNVLPLDDRRIERQRRARRPPGAREGETHNCCSAAWDASARTASSTSRTGPTRSRR